MSATIRDAAQALFNAVRWSHKGALPGRVQRAYDNLHTALAAPAPADDERVAELMKTVDEFSYAAGMSAISVHEGIAPGSPDHSIAKQRFNRTRAAVEASVRALLAASRQDAEHAAMYRWLRGQHEESDSAESFCVFAPVPAHSLEPVGIMPGELDAAIRAAMQAEPAESNLPERDPTRTNAQQGLYAKFIVRRTDGSDAPGGKHHGCDYFVLDVTHDKHAKAALAGNFKEVA